MAQLASPSTTSAIDSAVVPQRTTVFARPTVWLAVIVLVGLGLRLYNLGTADYWDDETITIFAARQPPLELLTTITANDSHPPLYHMMLHIWMQFFGDGLVAIRLFSALISLACVPMVYLLGRELVSKPVGLAAAVLMALSPFQIYHGQQARMYPLLTLIVLLTMLTFVQAWRRGDWWRWGGFGLCAAAGFYTHVYFPFSLLGLNVWAVYATFQQRRIDWRRWTYLVEVQLGALLLFMPFLPTMFGLTKGVVENFWIRSNTALDGVLASVNLINAAALYLGPEIPRWRIALLGVVSATAFIVTLVYSLREMLRCPEERNAWVLLHCAFWTPIVVATVLSLTVRPILLDRSLIAISGPLFLLMSWMFVRFWRTHLARGVAGLLLVSMLASTFVIYARAPSENGLHTLANFVALEQQPGDAVVYADWQSFDMAVLLHPQQPDVYLLESPLLDRAYWQRRANAMRWHTPDHIGAIPEFGARYKRVWLTVTDYTYELPYQKQHNVAWLEQHGTLTAEYDYGRATLYLYTLDQ